MARSIILFLHFLTILSMKQLALCQDESQFIYNGFQGANLQLDRNAVIHPNGLLQLTNTAINITGQAFHRFPLKFNSSSFGMPEYHSFSTNFVVSIIPKYLNFSGGHGLAFIISPSMDFSAALPNLYLGLFNYSNNGNSSNHIVAVELDTVLSPVFDDIDDNHVGIDVNSLNSIASAPVSYYSNGKNESLNLDNGHPIQVWIEYDDVEKLLNVSLAPANIPKPNLPLLSTPLDLSSILLEYMYVGFSAATGAVTSDHYVLGWSFNKSGQAQNLDISKLPPAPSLVTRRESKKGLGAAAQAIIIAGAVLALVVGSLASFYAQVK